jgi:hypothetical protein
VSQLPRSFRLRTRPVRLVAGSVFFALSAVTLVWSGHAIASKGGADRAERIATTVSNVATGKADAVTAGDRVCTAAPFDHDMPGMSKTFSFGGTKARPVLVFFQGEFGQLTEGAEVSVGLSIDGVRNQEMSVDSRSSGEPDEFETHGFNWVSGPLAPGTHTAKLQWADNGAGPGCVDDRSLIILHR